ncbi:uncharacterized protein LOC122319765 [Drosophila ficusphila]|uniref:uncharacterized protein LOC122319765 n=1 Tax=Drosophila ficusphila TaxID=30025 RepID=UPI001C8ADED8|nr:uncharacterized protein LOC122319765 [Drosophila ficusphila]
MRKMQVLIQTRDGRKSIYEVDRFGTVGNLKSRIGSNLSVPMGFSRLTYKGRILANHSILEDVGIRRMSTLDLCWQPVVLTPKQLSEKEGDLDRFKFHQKAMEPFDQKTKTVDVLNASDDYQDGEDIAGEIPNLPETRNSIIPEDDDELEELLFPSSDGLEFLSVNTLCKKSVDRIGKEQNEEEEPLNPEPIALPSSPVDIAIKPETKGLATTSTIKTKKAKKNRKRK